MKKIIGLVSLVLIFNFCFGQSKEIKTISFRDYMVTKMVYLYLNKYTTSPKPNNIKQSDFDIDKNNYTLIKNKLVANSFNNPVSIDSLSSILIVNNYKSTNISFIPEVKKILSDTSGNFINEIYKIDCNITKDENVKNEKENFIKELHTILNSISKISNSASTNKPGIETNENADTDDKKQNSNEMQGFWNFSINIEFILIVIDSIFIIILFIIIIILRTKLDERIKKRKESIEALEKLIGNGSQNSNSKSENSELRIIKNNIQLLENKIRYLESNFSDLKNQSQSQPHSKDNITIIYNENKKEHTKQQIEEVVFYMKSPKDKIFNINSKSDVYKPGFFFYKFTLCQNQKEAHFEFISDENTISVIKGNNIDVVESGCNMETQPTQNITKVKTTKKGFAKLENDNWKILEKANIKFE